MRALLTKVVAGSMIAGAALLVSACSKTEAPVANNTTEVTNTTETINTTDEMVTTTDAANGSGAVANDVAADNAGNAM